MTDKDTPKPDPNPTPSPPQPPAGSDSTDDGSATASPQAVGPAIEAALEALAKEIDKAAADGLASGSIQQNHEDVWSFKATEFKYTHQGISANCLGQTETKAYWHHAEIRLLIAIQQSEQYKQATAVTNQGIVRSFAQRVIASRLNFGNLNHRPRLCS